MLDARVRALINPPLDVVARGLARTAVSPNWLTYGGLGLGVAASCAVALGSPHIGLALLLASRLADGLDGALARIRGATQFGGYLDIIADFTVWALLPLGFAYSNPAFAFSAAVLLASFFCAGTTFLGYAILAAQAGETTRARGEKSFFHLGGLTEGTETLVFFVIVFLWPAAFQIGALVFAGLAFLTALGRFNMARAAYGSD